MRTPSELMKPSSKLPRHLAVIMDGNGRWARQRFLPRVAGHRAGVDALHKIVKHAMKRGIEILTLFAFSSENWRRPSYEVSYLLDLFLNMLENETQKLHEQGIQLRIIGDCSQFNEKLQAQMAQAQDFTSRNKGLKLVIAANYGGQWDLTQAMRKIGEELERGTLSSANISAELINARLSLGDLPPPDLFIRTSGEQRISNFLLWDLAYTELYFTEVLWPDFNEVELDKALVFFSGRERRFGCTSEQLEESSYA